VHLFSNCALETALLPFFDWLVLRSYGHCMHVGIQTFLQKKILQATNEEKSNANLRNSRLNFLFKKKSLKATKFEEKEIVL
jgi:hypothetical protein